MNLSPASPAHSPSVLNMRRLLVLRACAMTGWLVALAVVMFGMHVPIDYRPVLALLSAWALVSAVSWRRSGAGREIGDRAFLAQLALDVLMLTALLYFTGGATNPLTLLYLLPLVMAAALLTSRYTWFMVLLTVAGYTLVLYFYVPLPALEHHAPGHFGMHIAGMWWGFVLSAALIAAFAARMGETLRERDRNLARAREQALRDEQLVALGSLAAGTAHELGTPLGTIALLAGELEREYAHLGPDFTARCRLLRDQVGRCKQSLAMLSASAGQMQAEAGRSLPLDRFLSRLVEQWRSMRLGIQASCDLSGVSPAPVILADQSLSQALISILNNAADASPQRVEITARWTRARLELDVCDQGAGLSPAARAQAGKSVFSTKAAGQGLGLGLYLAHAVIGRLGGQVELFDREGGGACTRVTLPLDRLLVQEAAGG